MCMTSKSTSKCVPKADAKFHEGKWLGLSMKSDESIIGTPNGVIKAKTLGRLPENQRWCAEEVLSIRGLPSNPVREKCDNQMTVAPSDPAVRRMYITRSHIRDYGATEGCPRCKGSKQGRLLPHNNECRTRIKARMEQSEEGREGVEKDEQ